MGNENRGKKRERYTSLIYIVCACACKMKRKRESDMNTFAAFFLSTYTDGGGRQTACNVPGSILIFIVHLFLLCLPKRKN